MVVDILLSEVSTPVAVSDGGCFSQYRKSCTRLVRYLERRRYENKASHNVIPVSLFIHQEYFRIRDRLLRTRIHLLPASVYMSYSTAIIAAWSTVQSLNAFPP